VLESGSESEKDAEEIKPDHWAVKIIKSAPFVTLSLVCILGNTCVLAMDRYQNTVS